MTAPQEPRNGTIRTGADGSRWRKARHVGGPQYESALLDAHMGYEEAPRPRTRRVRVIDDLRRMYPDVTWSYSYSCGSRWSASDGRVVVARSALDHSPSGSETYDVAYLWEASGRPVGIVAPLTLGGVG